MHPIGQTCIYIWALASLVAFISAIVFIIRAITKKNRKSVKRVFWIAVAISIASFILYGVTSPVTRCDHEFTTIVDQQPTCTENGRKEQYCPLCDFTKKDTIKATGHNMVTESQRDPTYEADGEIIEKCSVCDYEVVTKIDMLVKETKPTDEKDTVSKPTETVEPESNPAETTPTEKPKTDKEIAKEVSDSIANIGTVTLEKEEEILKIKDRYDQLSKKQQKRVKNYDVLERCLAELDALHELERLKNDPTYTLTENDMVGIWKARFAGDTHTAYYYFANNGYIYYIAAKETPSQSSFTSEYRISTSYDFDGYDKNDGLMKGTFYCDPTYDTFDFSVERDESGNMTMVISRNGSTRGTGQGTFIKTSIRVNGNAATGTGSGNAKNTCEICSREGTNRYDSFTGQTEYYCTQHYEELLEMLEAFGIN